MWRNTICYELVSCSEPEKFAHCWCVCSVKSITTTGGTFFTMVIYFYKKHFFGRDASTEFIEKSRNFRLKCINNNLRFELYEDDENVI